jgi:hypothetical protein
VNDDELLARLKSADPALTSKAPLPDINRLVEATLSTDVNVDLNSDTALQPAKTPGRVRRNLFGLAAAAGLLMLAGGVAGGIITNNDSGHSTSATPLTLTVAGSSGKCQEPVPDRLRGYPTLFVGTVTSVNGALVTFRVDYWLNGGGTDTVVLDSDTDQPEHLTFSDGGRYIVGARDGVVPSCAANAASDETIGKFRQAFGK